MSTASTYSSAQAIDLEQARRFRECCTRDVAFYRLPSAAGSAAPRVYTALVDPDAGRLLLLLEDLAGGEPGDALRGCGVARARAVIEAIATLHARWWEQAALSEMAWLPPWAGDPAARAARYRAQLGPVLERYGERIPTPVRDLALALQDHYAAVLAALNGPPTTLIHADLHLDNVLFTAAGDTPMARIIDWQSVTRGLGAFDIALFITGALSISDRRAAEHDLLKHYHQLLSASGVRDYTHGQLLDDYRLALLCQLGGTVGWPARVDLATLTGREHALVEALFEPGQLFAALEDHRTPLLVRLYACADIALGIACRWRRNRNAGRTSPA